MKKIIAAAALAFCSAFHAQEQDSIQNKINISGNFEHNGQWYTNDVQRQIKHDPIPLRSNNYLSLNASYGKFSAGIQAESYVNEALLNFNPKYTKTNVATYYANYKNDQWDITAGYFYEQFGSGLALRSWEDRSLGINNALRGGRVKYTPTENLAFTALYGRQRSGFDVSKGDIFGFNTEIGISQLLFPHAEWTLNYGGSVVNRSENLPEGITKINKNTFVISNRIGVEKNQFYANFEHDYKSPDAVINAAKINYDWVKSGSAYLLNLGYAEKGFGVDATIRRIENMLFLSERKPEVYSPENTSLNYNDKMMNYVPSLTKQHHSSLANIYVYQTQNMIAMQFDEKIQKFGEIGGQIDLFYEFKKGSALGGKYGTKVAANFATLYNLAANYSYFDANGDYSPRFTSKFLGADQNYFREFSIEVSKKLSPTVKGNISLINQHYNDQYIRGIFQKSIINATTLFSEATISFANSRSITASLEHLWADSDRKNWLGGSIEYVHNNNWSLFVSDMYNYGFDPNEHLISATDMFKIHFYNVGATYRQGSTRVSLNYGRQRGGLVCAGGICRFVPPSTGLGLQINTTF
ncbi:MAG: hypothetical protein JSS94_02790 [Bacteroidetes bacterium]|nr:hypothetical protein [Bacteroidota bacterium]